MQPIPEDLARRMREEEEKRQKEKFDKYMREKKEERELKQLGRKKTKMKTLFLDTETTGFNPINDRIVEIAIIDSNCRVLLNSLVNPQRPIGYATKIHGITDNMVVDAPTLKFLWPKIYNIGNRNHIVIYNAQFDIRFFPDKLSCAGKIDCAMLRFSEFFGEKTKKPGGYKWQKLAKAASYFGYKWEGDPHRALSDTLATRWVWEKMEPSKTEIPKRAVVSKKKTVSKSKASAMGAMKRAPWIPIARTNQNAEPKLPAVSSFEAYPTPAERGGRWHPPTADVRHPLTERTLANFHTRPRSTSCIHKQAGENSSNLELAITRGEL